MVLPWEVTQLGLIVNNFLTAANYLNEEDFKQIKFQISYSNIDGQIDWEKSKINKQSTEQMFINSCELLSKFFTVSYEIDNTLLGCVGHRRREFEKYDYDYCCTFDTDIHFDYILLKMMIDASKLISLQDNNPHIITPSIPCYWDDSWNVVSMFPSKEYDYWKKSVSLFGITLCIDNVNIVRIPQHKWGGGFFTCYSKLFLEKYKLPDELGNTYGYDDTYLMFKAQYETVVMKNVISQYLLQGLLVFDKRDFGPYINIRNLFEIKSMGNQISPIKNINDLQKLILKSYEKLLHQSN